MSPAPRTPDHGLHSDLQADLQALFASLAADLPAEPLIDLAYITGAWGVKGWVRLVPFSADADALQESPRWFIAPPQGTHARGSRLKQHLQVQVRALKVQGDGLVAQLAGIGDRDQAQALRGATIALPRSAFPALPEDEYYWVDLIGLQVRNREGLVLGRVEKMLSNGPQSVLVVIGEKGDAEEGGKAREHLIPFVEVYVDTVDLDGRCITVDWQPDY